MLSGERGYCNTEGYRTDNREDREIRVERTTLRVRSAEDNASGVFAT